MLRGGSGSAMAFAQLLEQISEVAEAAKHVVVCHGSFAHLSSFLEKIRLLLREVQEGPRVVLAPLYIIIQPLETELKNAKELINICTIKSRFYLLLNCRTFTTCIQSILQSVATTLLQLSADSVEITLKFKNRIKLLCKDMQATQSRLSAAEEDLVDQIELGTRDPYVGTKFSNEILHKMAVVTGVSSDPSSLRHEYDELRREKETVALNKHETEVFQLDLIISLLSSADALGSATERERHYQERRRGLDCNFLPPLQTFYCPITQEVMVNPVEIDSRQTFEMSAIQKWFAEGHNVCPVTKMELQNLSLRPNRSLQKSIEEWRDINTFRKLAGMAARLRSGNEEGITEALLEIQDLCEEKSVHKYWIAAEGLIPVLVGLLASNKRELRKKTLATLSTLVVDNSDNRVKLCEAGAIEYAVRSLARDAGEARQAVALLLELSKEESLCERISKVQGCILLLVTMANSDNTPAAVNAKELLKLLAKTDDNVVLMADFNYFKPLVQCLDEGSQLTQILMANTLSRMQLSDQSRALLVQGGVLAPLVKMASVGNLDCKVAALGAFRNLSVLPENRDPMIEAGVMQSLLEILFTVRSIAATVREHAAATFANLAMSSQSFGIRDLWGNRSDTDVVILQLMSLLSLTGADIQSHILRALSCICGHSTSVGLRETLREGGIIQLLIQLLTRSMDAKDTEVRLYALKLLFTLTKDGGKEILAEEMAPDSYQVMVDLFSAESLEEEKTAAMGILGNLPLHNRQVTERMLQARVLPSIVTILERGFSRTSGRINTPLVENAAWTLVRFTLPTDIRLQEHTAKHDVIPLLVNLLSFGTSLTKCRAAMSLQQFSESTPKLSVPIKGSGGWCCFARTRARLHIHNIPTFTRKTRPQTSSFLKPFPDSFARSLFALPALSCLHLPPLSLHPMSKKKNVGHHRWRWKLWFGLCMCTLLLSLFKLQTLVIWPYLSYWTLREAAAPAQPKVAFLFLARNRMPLDIVWDLFFREGQMNLFSIYIHSRPGFVYNKRTTICKHFYNRQLRNSILVDWGEASMIEAERLLLAEALKDPANDRFLLLSDSCVPLYNFTYVYDYVMASTKSFVDSFLDAKEKRYNPKMAPVIQRDKWRKGSQWFALKRDHAAVIAFDADVFPSFQEHCKRRPLPEFWRQQDMNGDPSKQHNCIPDEHYVQTLLAIRGFEGEIERRTLTYTLWNQSGKDQERKGWHPVTFVYSDANLELLNGIKGIKSVNYDTEYRTEWCSSNETLRPCFLFARKFTRGAGLRLLNQTISKE